MVGPDVVCVHAGNDCDRMAKVGRQYSHQAQRRHGASKDHSARMAAEERRGRRRSEVVMMCCSDILFLAARLLGVPHGHDGGNEEGLVAKLRDNHHSKRGHKGMCEATNLRSGETRRDMRKRAETTSSMEKSVPRCAAGTLHVSLGRPAHVVSKASWTSERQTAKPQPRARLNRAPQSTTRW